jgi:hypothetical protein
LNDLCIYIFGVVCKYLIVLFTGETRFRSNQGKVGDLFVALVLSSERQLQDYYCGEDLKEEDAALLFPGREDKRRAFYLSFAVEIESHRFPKNAPVVLCNPRHIFSGTRWISCSRKSLNIPKEQCLELGESLELG